ncbi:response regulator [Clostridium saudiense]|uniref:response regulator transcription factor n=1 Tax=Clostridium saudiense TaxID=1414720 RepID=UPI0025939E81|nr:response regulator [uncultured Clostridium sp.]
MINILIVDDEPFIRQGLKILINWNFYGYNIIGEASNGNEAIKFVEKNKVDLIISDIKMPEMDGLGLAKNIYEKYNRKIKCIMLSGYYEFEYAKKAIKYGVKEYVLKPIEREELIGILISLKEEYEKERKSDNIKARNEKVIYEGYLNRILCNNYSDDDINYVNKYIRYKNYLRYINIEIYSNENSEEIKTCNKSKVYNKLRQWLGEKNYYNIVYDIIKEDKIDGIGLIFSSVLAEEFGINEQQYIEKVKEVLNSSNEYTCRLLIGKKVEALSEIGISYNSLYMIKILQGDTSVKDIFYYDDIDSKKSIDYNLINTNIAKLIKSIEDSDVVKIEDYINLFYGAFNNDTNNLKIIKIYIDYLLCNLINIIKESNSSMNEEKALEYIDAKLFNNIITSGTAYDLKIFCVEVSAYIKDLRSNSMHNILALIDKEVSENYMQPLTLKYLSEKYYLNTAYLGQLFKKNYNKSFKDYLNDYRIEKASLILKRSNEKIYKIAEDVGYNNTDYFISKFVQIKGVTPLQYRKKFRD